MLTQRALLLGFVAFCFYLIAVVNSLPGFYYVLMWLAIGLLAASLGIAFLSLSGLHFTWKLARSRGHASAPECAVSSALGASAGASATREDALPLVEAALKNIGSLNKTGIVIEVHLREVSRETGREAQVSLGFLLEAVAAGQSLEVALPLRPLPRGCYQLREVQLVGSDVLGLFRARRRVALEGAGEVLVAPALLPGVAGASLGRGGRAQRSSQRRARPGGGDELRGTRPYVAGDDMRHIHWKSTARTGELVMREWEQVGHASTLVVWDGASGSDWGVGAGSSAECALVVVASLLESYANAQLPCALATLGHEAWFCPSERGSAVSGARSGRAGREVAEAQLEALARARIGRQTPLFEALSSVWTARDASDVLVVSASLAPDLVALTRELTALGLSVRVALLDGAALGRASGDRRFRRRTNGHDESQRAPLQEGGPAREAVAVTSAAYRAQTQNLERAGALVALCAPHTQAEIWPALQRTLLRLLYPGGRAGRAASLVAATEIAADS